MFSLVENNTDTPIDPAAVHGQVDIIARISDRILDAAWIVIPYRIEWWVENMSSVVVVPARDFVVETGDCFDNATGENSLDIVQVLDRTGSMSEYAGETSTDRKIEVLRYAADEFIQMMKPDIGNRLGIVQFNQDVVPFPPPDPGLKELTAGNVPDFRGSVASIVNGGTTKCWRMRRIGR